MPRPRIRPQKKSKREKYSNLEHVEKNKFSIKRCLHCGNPLEKKEIYSGYTYKCEWCNIYYTVVPKSIMKKFEDESNYGRYQLVKMKTEKFLGIYTPYYKTIKEMVKDSDNYFQVRKLGKFNLINL